MTKRWKIEGEEVDSVRTSSVEWDGSYAPEAEKEAWNDGAA